LSALPALSDELLGSPHQLASALHCGNGILSFVDHGLNTAGFFPFIELGDQLLGAQNRAGGLSNRLARTGVAIINCHFDKAGGLIAFDFLYPIGLLFWGSYTCFDAGRQNSWMTFLIRNAPKAGLFCFHRQK
jgi:hypothetical protein